MLYFPTAQLFVRTVGAELRKKISELVTPEQVECRGLLYSAKMIRQIGEFCRSTYYNHCVHADSVGGRIVVAVGGRKYWSMVWQLLFSISYIFLRLTNSRSWHFHFCFLLLNIPFDACSQYFFHLLLYINYVIIGMKIKCFFLSSHLHPNPQSHCTTYINTSERSRKGGAILN